MPPFIVNRSSRAIAVGQGSWVPGLGSIFPSRDGATNMAPTTHIDLHNLQLQIDNLRFIRRGPPFICQGSGQWQGQWPGPQIAVEVWLEDYRYKKTLILDTGASVYAVDSTRCPSAVDISYIWYTSHGISRRSEICNTIYLDRH